MATVEIATAGSTLYLATCNYVTRSTDTPANTWFQPRLKSDVTFDRAVGTVFWGKRPRGSQNFGSIDVVNTDGEFDSLVGSSLRDKAVTIRRGESNDAYSTFAVVATLLVDRIEFVGERLMRVYVKDTSAKLERALQQTMYPATITNQALRGRPRPITIGRCDQIPVQQPDMFGNGHFDLHDGEQFVGIEQLLDQGVGLLEGTAYQRSSKSGIYGFERLNAIAGKQAASVLGAFIIASTPVTDDFTSLSNWTETGGGVAGRDASIVSNELRMQNTAGGADLLLDWNGGAVTATAADYFFYEFDCTSYTSGSLTFRSNSTVVERTISATGRYTGIVRASANWTPRFYALNGSNCDLRIDNFRVRKITPIEQLSDVITYLTVTKSLLSSGDLDATAISALQSAAPYALGFHASEPIQVADVLDQVLQSFGGWWYMSRLGKLTVGRLLAPSGSPAWTFDASKIANMRIEFDGAPGLSNVLLAKRNWSPYGEGELVASLNTPALNSADKDADVALSNSNYSYSATNVGAVRSTPLIAGGRYYVEVTPTTVDGTQQHYLGWGSAAAAIGQYPGQDANSIGFRANGQRYVSASGSAFGSSWSAANKIPMAIDARAAAMGCRQQHHRFYWAIDSTWQNSANPVTETGYITANANVTGWQYVMVGNNVAGTNAGTVNFGQSTFTLAPPDDYWPIAWHRQLTLADYRYKFQSSTSLHASYAHAVSAPTPTGSGDNLREYAGGIPTLLSAMADARTECDRWCAIYASERFFYTFDAFLDSGVSADQVECGDLISVTYARFGLSSKLLRVVGIKGSLLGRKVEITAWG